MKALEIAKRQDLSSTFDLVCFLDSSGYQLRDTSLDGVISYTFSDGSAISVNRGRVSVYFNLEH